MGEDDLQEIQKFIDNNAESVFDDEKYSSIKTPLKNWSKNFLKIHQIFSNLTTKNGLAEVSSLNNFVNENNTGFCVARVTLLSGPRFQRKQKRRIIELGTNKLDECIENDDNDSIW